MIVPQYQSLNSLAFKIVSNRKKLRSLSKYLSGQTLQQKKKGNIRCPSFLFKFSFSAQIIENRALWVVRDHMVSREKIDEVLNFAIDNNYNHLFVQIRGRGDAYYKSSLVPRSHLVQITFDPLEYIVKKAKSEEIKIHAWINVFYLWSSPQTPSQDGHILLNHLIGLILKFPIR